MPGYNYGNVGTAPGVLSWSELGNLQLVDWFNPAERNWVTLYTWTSDGNLDWRSWTLGLYSNGSPTTITGND